MVFSYHLYDKWVGIKCFAQTRALISQNGATGHDHGEAARLPWPVTPRPAAGALSLRSAPEIGVEHVPGVPAALAPNGRAPFLLPLLSRT